MQPFFCHNVKFQKSFNLHIFNTLNNNLLLPILPLERKGRTLQKNEKKFLSYNFLFPTFADRFWRVVF